MIPNIIPPQEPFVSSTILINPHHARTLTSYTHYYRQVYGDSPNKMVQFMSPGGTLQIPREPIMLKLEDVKFVTVSQFIAWCVSDKVPPPKTTGTYRTILRVKYGFYRWMRETTRFFKHIYDVAQHLRSRSVFRDFQPAPVKSALHPDKSNRSTTLLNVTVGKGGMIDNPGIEISGRLAKLDGPMFDLKCTKMKFPKDFGTVFSIDIDLRSTAGTCRCRFSSYSRYR